MRLHLPEASDKKRRYDLLDDYTEEVAFFLNFAEGADRKRKKHEIAKRFLNELASAINRSPQAKGNGNGIGKGIGGIYRGDGVQVFGLKYKIAINDDMPDDWAEEFIGGSNHDMLVGYKWITFHVADDSQFELSSYMSHAAGNMLAKAAKKAAQGAKAISRERGKDKTKLQRAADIAKDEASSLKVGSKLEKQVIRSLERRGFFKALAKKLKK